MPEWIMASELQPDVDALAARIRANDRMTYHGGYGTPPVCITDQHVRDLLAARGLRFVAWREVDGQSAIEVA